MSTERAAAPLSIVFLGLSITSSWGNGHATTYRGLVRELVQRGHDVCFLERDVPWYASNRDLPHPPFGATYLYRSLDELKARFRERIRDADIVVVGSYVPDGIAVGDWVMREARGATAFYDIDTPVTLDRLESGDAEYIARSQVPRYDLYLSFAGGPVLDRLARRYGVRQARPLYCSVDPAAYAPLQQVPRWDLGYLGTYSDDRQPAVERLLCAPARLWPEARFAVIGPQYPADIAWPVNVERVDHLAPDRHRAFYTSQRFTLNVTRAAMTRAGWSPSVRLFEAAACATPIITDDWPGLADFFAPDDEILVARGTEDTLRYLRDIGEEQRKRIGEKARDRVLRHHTAARRATEFEGYAVAVLGTTERRAFEGEQASAP